MSTRLSYRLATAVALVISALALTPLGASAGPALGGTSASLRSPAWMRHAPTRPTAAPVGGALTEAELPGASNPSEPYAAVSQALTGRPVGQPSAAGLGTHVQRMTVNPVTGHFSLSLGDPFVPERGVPLGLSLTYNSYFASTDGPFGRGWSFNAGMSLTQASDGSMTVSQENGSQVTFQRKSGGYVAAPRVIASLRTGLHTYVFTRGTRGTNCPQYSRSCLKFFFSKSASGKPGHLTRISSPDGDLTLVYNKRAQLTATKDPAGRTLSFTFTAGKIRNTAVDANEGFGERMAYDANGNLTRFTSAGRSRYGFLYDAYHRMIGIVDPRGAETHIVYDAGGAVQSITDPTGETQYTRTPAQTSVSHLGGATTIHYASREVTRIDEGSDPVAPLATTLITYDPRTLGPTAVTNPDGHTSHMTYDALGHLTSLTDPLGHTSTYNFGAATGIITATDPMGTVSRATADGKGRLVSIALDVGHPALTQTTTFHYGNAAHPGDMTSATDAEGHLWRFAYDKFGNPTRFTDPLGHAASASYDRMGRPAVNTALNGNVAGADPDDFSTTFEYDPEGRLLSTTDPLGNTESNSYDRAGNLVATVSGGNQTGYGYDAAGRWAVISRPNGSKSTLSYLKNGSVGEVCDDGGNCEEYTYDDLGLPATFTDALGNTSSFLYSAGGLLLSSTDANGVTTSYSHDDNGRTTGVSYSDGTTHPVAFDFDADGRLHRMTDATGTSSFFYDSLGRKTKEVSGLGMESDLVYDRLDHVTSMTLNSTPMAAYKYDGRGNLIQLKDRLGNATTFSYDASSNLIQTLFPGGDVDRAGYDNAGRLVHFSHSESASDPASIAIAYTRNLLGQITQADQTGTGQPSLTYGYDANGRLIKAKQAVNFVPQNFDERDNLLQNDSGDTFTYDAANRVVTEAEKENGLTVDWQFGYDHNGSRTSAFTLDGTRSHDSVWDAAGNLASFTDGSTSESNTYDGLGRRVLLNNGGNTVISVWGSTHATPRVWGGGGPTDPRDDDCNGSAGAIYCAKGTTVPGPFNPAQWDKIAGVTPGTVSFRSAVSNGSAGAFMSKGTTARASGPIAVGGTVYLYGPEGLPVEQLDSSDQALFYHHDQLGSTRAVTDATGHTVEVVAYDTWGNEAYHSGTVSVPFGFGGGYTDPVSHLVLIGHDYYDAPTSQFVTRIRRAITVGQNAPVLLRIRRAITVGQNAPVLLRSAAEPKMFACELMFDMYEDQGSSAELFFDTYEKQGLSVELFFDGYEEGSALRGVFATNGAYARASGLAVSSGMTSPYSFGGGDPINGAWKEFSPAEEQLKANPRH